jgi:hypothetical protein
MCGSGDLERCSRSEPEPAQAGDEGEEQLLETPIVGDVEKGVARRIALRNGSASASYSPPRCGPTLTAVLTPSRFPASRRCPIASVTLQILGHHCPDLPVPPGGDAEDACRCRRGGVGRRDHRAGSQGHGLTLRSGGCQRQCARKDTALSSRGGRGRSARPGTRLSV